MLILLFANAQPPITHQISAYTSKLLIKLENGVFLTPNVRNYKINSFNKGVNYEGLVEEI